jgi:hypothetical protein
MARQHELDRRRYYGLLWFLVGFIAWQGGRTVQEIWPSLEGTSAAAFVTGIALVGWGAFAYHLVRLLLMKRELSDAGRRQMNDERVRQNRRTSFAVGFWAILALTVPLRFAPGLSSTAIANLVVLVGVAASVGTFLYVEALGAPPAPNTTSAEVDHE